MSRATIGDRRSEGRLRGARVAAVLTIAVLVVACLGQNPPAAPSATPLVPATPRVKETQRPFITTEPVHITPRPELGCAELIEQTRDRQHPDRTLPPLLEPAIKGPDEAARAAIAKAVERLRGLDSYRFTLDAVDREPYQLQRTAVDFRVEGTVTHDDGFAIDGRMGTLMREPDGSAAISSGGSLLAGHGFVWWVDNVSGVLEPSPDEEAFEQIANFAPEGLASRVIVPFAAGYRHVGSERHGGVMTEHYRRTAGGAAAYQAALAFRKDVQADLWIASDSGALVGATIRGTDGHKDPNSGAIIDDSFLLAFEVNRANDPANVVNLPALPVADPVRPATPAVDLQLEVRALPRDGVRATATDLDAIGVALRTRLGVSERPVRVEIVQDRLVVTICGTTRPVQDRALVLAPGVLSVVQVPAGAAAPAIGSTIDLSVASIVPPGGLGLTSVHTDPVTGERGLALGLNNRQREIFMAYAKEHPGTSVAVALDGVVLAVLPIEGQTAKGNLVFTGDYTFAEARQLASWLYRDPIAFKLELVSDAELPAG